MPQRPDSSQGAGAGKLTRLVRVSLVNPTPSVDGLETKANRIGQGLSMFRLLTLKFEPPRPTKPLESAVVFDPLLDLLTSVLPGPIVLANRSEALTTVVQVPHSLQPTAQEDRP